MEVHLSPLVLNKKTAENFPTGEIKLLKELGIGLISNIKHMVSFEGEGQDSKPLPQALLKLLKKLNNRFLSVLSTYNRY